MKKIEVDDELYHYIASRTQFIGETASEILRRLLKFPSSPQSLVLVQEDMLNELKSLVSEKQAEQELIAQQLEEQEEKDLVSSQQENTNVQQNIEEDKEESKEEKAEMTLILARLDTLLASSDFIDETKAVRRFLAILSILYFSAPQRFTYGTENIQGSERIYFAKDEQAILSTGSGVRAKQIPETPFWVITNNNTERKGIILAKLMEAMSIPEDYIQRIKAFFI